MSIKKSRYSDYMQQRGGYAVVPNEIWETDLDHTAKVIWCYLLSRSPTWDSSRNNLARNLKMGTNTITHYIELLRVRGMVLVTLGARNSWDFEIVPPNEWAANAATEAATAPVLNSTGAATAPLVKPPRLHTQEERRETERQDTHTVTEELINKPDQQPSTETDSIDSIFLSWSASLPTSVGKSRKGYLYGLFDALKESGFKSTDLDVAFKRRVLDKLVPDPRPKNTTAANYATWKKMALMDYEEQHTKVFSVPRVFKQAPIVGSTEQITDHDDAELAWVLNNIKKTKKKRETEVNENRSTNV